jgi:hypothetical protein
METAIPDMDCVDTNIFSPTSMQDELGVWGFQLGNAQVQTLGLLK